MDNQTNNPPRPHLDHLQDAAGYHRSDPRTREAGFYPGFAHGRGLAPIQQIKVVQSSVTVNNGDVAKMELLTKTANNNLVIVSNEMNLYVGSINDLNLLPAVFNGSSTDMSQWQLYGPFNSIISGILGGAAVSNSQNSHQVIVRNISAGTVTLIFQARTKYIINYGGTGSS